MASTRYTLTGNWYKGNTHLHSTASDGGKTVDELASRAGLSVAFETLSEQDEEQVQSLLGGEISAVVGPSALARHPVLLELRRLDRRFVLVETDKSGAVSE